MLPFKKLSKSDKRITASRKQLESAVTEVVKSAADCEAFVGVIIERIEPKSRTKPNWAIRGVRFGKTDRDKSGKVLANVVERMQLEFSLIDKHDDDALPTKALKWEVIPICHDEEAVSVASEYD